MMLRRVLPVVVLLAALAVAIYVAETGAPTSNLTPPPLRDTVAQPVEDNVPLDRESKARAHLDAYLLALTAGDAQGALQSWSTDTSITLEVPGLPPATGPADVTALHRQWLETVASLKTSAVRLRVVGARAEAALMETVQLRLDAGLRQQRHVAAVVMLWTDAGWRITSHRVFTRNNGDAGPAAAE